jgi:lysophospholipase L1-like esterase
MPRPHQLGSLLAGGLLLAAAATAAPTVAAEATSPPKIPTEAVTTWAASDDMAGGTLDDITVRNIVHTSVGGSDLRVRLSNAKGTKPVTFDQVFVGRQSAGAALVPGSNRRITFEGSPRVVIAPGTTVLSDPLDGRVRPQQNLAISIHVSGDSGALTAHNRSMQTTYKSTTGDHAADEDDSAFQTESSVWFWLDAVVVEAPKSTGTVATLGDSITAGVGTTMDANHRWPDVLADRFALLPTPAQLGVANEGISGNRVLSGESRPGGSGDAALVRLEQDLLTKPGVETVLVHEGVNDIGAGSSAAEIIAGYRELIMKTRAHDVCIVGSTIMPFGGSVYVDPEGETVRQEVNDFVRTSGEFDAVVDFDQAVRDPGDPTRLRPDFHDGDGLHPNDAGNAAMARAIDLDDLRCD